MQLGTKLMSARKHKRMTQAELGDLMNVSTKTVQRWEAGQSSPKTTETRKLAEVLNVPVAELLSDSPAELPPNPVPVQDKPAEEPLVYEWGGKNRIALPNTPETRAMFERLVQSVISAAPAAVN